ncbi:Hypothetical protein, putative [Bodo saltans]|uniref:Protein kinase domain-containing protein n=2 Tax=Bodo saltans TaxID=75058 RepID=A0A0S4JKG4_BODSA|nr:Hypothetical protein, putative [Bodo saltans]|eukprot:CUG91992.1 Hypothetical protein, putative [Bodo saltans]
MDSVGSAERAHFAALTNSAPRNSTHITSTRVTTTAQHTTTATVVTNNNPLQASLISSAKYKSTSPLPPAGRSTPPKAAPAKVASNGRTSTPQGKSSPAAARQVQSLTKSQAAPPAPQTRANSGAVLSQSGVFATETGLTFGACRCEEHDSICAFVHHDWLSAFVEYNKGARSSARLFNLDPVPITATVARGGDGQDRNTSPNNFRRRSSVIGAWCSVDVLQRRRADILPPKRFMMIAGGHLQDESVELSDGMHVLEPSELMLFPQEPFDVDTGLVKSLPSASFPLTTRGITQDANSTLVDHGALSSCSALTFTRVRLAPRKFHLVVEVIGVPLGPLLEEHDTVLFGSRQTSLNSADEFRRSHFAPPPQLKLVEQLIAALVQGDEHIDQTADGAQVLAGATFGLFDAGLFFDTYGTLLDVTNRNRSWLAERLRDIFGMTESASSRVATSHKQPPLQPSELLAQRQKKLLELFEVIKSPLVPLEFRAPPSLWNATVQRTFQLLDQDASLRSGMSSLTLENLHFRDVNPPAPSATAAGGNANGNAGMVTHDAFGVIKSAVQVPSNVLYDVRCLPQNKTQLYCPDSCKGSACDGDTAVVLEYISRFPFVQRIYSILADSSRYFVVLPPVLSKAVERSRAPAIQQQAHSEEIMSLSDLSRRVSPQLRTSQFMDYVRLIASQLVLSVGLLHSRAIVIGSLTPRRILCKVTHGAAPVRASMIETSLTGIGTSSAASSWLRQQKGVIEYLSPAFVSQFLDVKLLDPSLEGLSSPPRAPVDPPTTPTVGAADDWWAVGCALFELFSRGTPLFPVEGKGDLLDMWLTLLVNRDSHAPQTRDTVVEVARDNVVRHIEESVHFESDRLLKSWEPSTALGAPKAQPSTASSTSSNLVTRRVEERKRMDASRQPSPARNGSQAPLSEERHQWKQSVTEFVDVLSVLCDIQSFSPAPHKEGLCPSDFHGVVVRLMAMPFFKSIDWVNVFNQTPSSLSTGAHIVSPFTHRPGSSERSHSADSSKGAALRNSPRRQNTSRIASSPRLSRNALNQKSNMLGVPMEASEPSESGATNDYGRPHPFVMYTADEAAVLVNLLQRKGTARDREMADAIKRQDVRLHQWSVEAIPELSGRNSFLRPTESNQMYQRAVKERKRQLVSTDTGSPGKGDRDSSPNRAAPAPQSSDVYVMGGGSIRTNTLDSTSKGGGTQSMISPLHHSYSFQRPKGFIDVVSDRKVGCVYDPAPLRNQGDVTAYTKPLLSKSSKTAVSSRHQGYLDPVGARDKVGAYVPPPPPSKTFGPPPPLPSYHGKDAQSRLAQSISRPHPGGPVVDAPQSYRARAWIDHVAGSTEVPAVVVSPPTTRPIPHHGQALNLTSVSPETPRSDDPSVALFTSPPQAATARSTNAGTTTSGSTPAGGTPANRPAVRLPGTDASSDRSSVHEGRSEGHTSDASSRFRGQRDSPSGRNVAQRPPRHAQAAPVALPPGVSSVRSTSADAAVSMSGPFANSSSSHAAPQQRPLPKRIPAAKPLGRWEKSDSDDEKPRDTRPAAQSRRGPSRSPKSSPRRHSDPQGQPRAQQVNRRELPPPPPPYDPMDDEDDDAEFS